MRIHRSNVDRFIGQIPAPDSNQFKTEYQNSIEIYETNLLSWIKGKETESVLDFGCGYGLFSKYLQDKGFSNIIALDPDARCLQKGQHSEKVITKLELNPLSYLENTSEKFSVITCINVGGYFDRSELPHYFNGFNRVLSEKGILLFSVQNAAAITGIIDYVQDPYFKSTFTDVLLRDLLEHSNFEILYLGPLKVPQKGLKRFAWLCAQNIWFKLLKFVYLLERGIGPRNPKHFNPQLFVVARKLDS